MDINNLEHCTLTTFKDENGEVRIYDFISDKNYCFRDTSQPIKSENGDSIYDHFTAFSLLSSEIDTLENYECVEFIDGMTIH